MNQSRYQRRREFLIRLYSKFRGTDIGKLERIMRLSNKLDYWQWQKPVVLNGRVVVGA